MGNAGQHAFRLGFRLLLAPLLGLGLVPGLLALLVVVELDAGKHVRMAADQFLADGRGDLFEIEQAALLGNLRVKHHLQQQIAQLAAQIVEIVALDGIGHFVGFFDGIRDQAVKILLQVPSATPFGVAQAGHQGKQILGFL